MQSKNIIILGGRGFLGKYVTKKLSSLGYQVTTFDRHDGSVGHIKGSILKPEDLEAAFDGKDIIINLVGLSPINTPKGTTYEETHVKAVQNIIDAAKKNHIKRIIQLSALGIEKGTQTVYKITKLAAENLLHKSSLNVSIIKPSFILGEGSELDKILSKIAPFKLVPFPKAPARLQPISAVEISEKIAQLVKAESHGVEKIPMPGKRILSMYEIVYASLRDLRAYVIPIPFWIFKVVLALPKKLKLFGINKDFISLFEEDNIL